MYVAKIMFLLVLSRPNVDLPLRACEEPLTPPGGEGAVSCGKIELLQDGSKEQEIGPPHQRQEGLGLMVIRGLVIKAFEGWFSQSWG